MRTLDQISKERNTLVVVEGAVRHELERLKENPDPNINGLVPKYEAAHTHLKEMIDGLRAEYMAGMSC